MTKTSDVFESHYYTYVLYSHKDHQLYIGYTTDLRKRFANHSNGNVRSTKNRRPLILIHYEYFIHKEDAEAREVYLKSGHGHQQLKKILQKTLMELNVTLEI